MSLRDVVVHRATDLAMSDITSLGGLPVTTPARTLVDLGAVSRPWLVSRALEQWLREGQVTMLEVRRVLDAVARKGRSGVGVLREVLDTRALKLEVSDSQAEVVLAEALRAHGAPDAVFHYEIRVGHDVFEVDFAYPEAMLVIEVDGYGPHIDPQRFRRGLPQATSSSTPATCSGGTAPLVSFGARTMSRGRGGEGGRRVRRWRCRGIGG